MIFKTLGEVCDKGDADVQTGPFGSQLHESDYVDEGVPVVMPKDIHDGRIDEDGVARVTEHKASTLPRHFLQAGDIVMPRRGKISKRALITEEQSGYLCGTGCVRIRLSNGSVHPQFLYYYLDQPHIIQWIEQRAIGSTMLNLNTSIVKAIPLPPIPYDEQRRIASVLSSYDDLIENNRKRIKLLERAARLLYTEWFVRGRFPGHQGVKVKDGVPEGWEKVNLAELVDTQYGYTETATDEPIGPKFLRGTDINKTSYINWVEVPYCPEGTEDLSRYKLSKGDLVVIRMADPGKVALIEKEVNAVFASYLVRLTVTSERISPNYLFHVLSDAPYQGRISGSSTGSTRKSASAKLLVDFKMLIPDPSTLRAFDEKALPLRGLLNNLLDQNAALTRARDLLLPRLMSGKVKV